MQQAKFLSASIAAIVAAMAGASAEASIILDSNVTSSFSNSLATVTPGGNDLPGHPSTLSLGQLRATADGFVDFFYIGNEAGYTNSLRLDGAAAHSTAGLADHFTGPYGLVGSIGVSAGGLLDFGLCAGGGSSLAGYGTCAQNDDAASLTAQFNYGGHDGYRSIGYRALTAFDASSSAYTFGGLAGLSNLWMIFFDDSGARNDDDHDDYVAVAQFRPAPVSVPEPATAFLVGTGLLAIGAMSRRRSGSRS